jgi:hypothetical protein
MVRERSCYLRLSSISDQLLSGKWMHSLGSKACRISGTEAIGVLRRVPDPDVFEVVEENRSGKVVKPLADAGWLGLSCR